MGAGGELVADSDTLILVDELDREIGHLGKDRCHDGQGILHRAFSLFVFNDRGELLVQRRAATKRLWPGFWSNSCCSHPRRAESMESAIHRRLYEELGIRCALEFLFKFRYQARFDAAGSEHELCSVFAGRHAGPVHPDRSEIMSWRWMSARTLEAQMSRPAAQKRFTPWFLLEWARIRQEYSRLLEAVPECDLNDDRDTAVQGV